MSELLPPDNLLAFLTEMQITSASLLLFCFLFFCTKADTIRILNSKILLQCKRPKEATCQAVTFLTVLCTIINDAYSANR